MSYIFSYLLTYGWKKELSQLEISIMEKRMRMTRIMRYPWREEGSANCIKSQDWRNCYDESTKASGTSGIAADMMQAIGDTAIWWIRDLCNDVAEGIIPDDWQQNAVLPIYKWKEGSSSSSMQRRCWKGLCLENETTGQCQQYRLRCLIATGSVSSRLF